MTDPGDNGRDGSVGVRTEASSDREVPPSRWDADDRAGAAVTAARARRARAWRWQLIAGLLVVVVLGATIWSVVRHSEIRAVRSQVASSAPSSLSSGAITATPTLAWRDGDQLALGDAVYQNVVVTYGERSVTGRDASTGAVRWSYLRTDRRLCAVDVQDGAVIAIYDHDGLCDEVTGLDAGTGKRSWVRTLLTTVSPNDLRVSSFNGNVLLAAPGSLELIEPTGGLDWWLDTTPQGCTVRSAVLGTSGVLIASRCLSGDTLSFRALGSSKNRDWTVALDGRTPVSADTLIGALSSDGRTISVVDATTGKTSASLSLSRTVTPASTPRATAIGSTSELEMIAIQGATIAVDRSSGEPLVWTRAGYLPSTGPALDTLLSAGAGEVVELDALQGTPIQTYRIDGATASDRVVLLGRGLLLSNANGVAAYR